MHRQLTALVGANLADTILATNDGENALKDCARHGYLNVIKSCAIYLPPQYFGDIIQDGMESRQVETVDYIIDKIPRQSPTILEILAATTDYVEYFEKYPVKSIQQVMYTAVSHQSLDVISQLISKYDLLGAILDRAINYDKPAIMQYILQHHRTRVVITENEYMQAIFNRSLNVIKIMATVCTPTSKVINKGRQSGDAGIRTYFNTFEL
jgi:hypothetical protein